MEAQVEAVPSGALATSQRFLDASFDTVKEINTIRKNLRSSRRGAGTNGENDMLRTAIVFAAAGLDATLKQIVRDALPTLLECNLNSRNQFIKFIERTIEAGGKLGISSISRYLASASPRKQLIEEYIEDATGSSLQSIAEVHRGMSILGIDEKAPIRRDTERLRPLFDARNKIVHELDLTNISGVGRRTKRTRKVNETEDWCRLALNHAQKVLNEVASFIG